MISLHFPISILSHSIQLPRGVTTVWYVMRVHLSTTLLSLLSSPPIHSFTSAPLALSVHSSSTFSPLSSFQPSFLLPALVFYGSRPCFRAQAHVHCLFGSQRGYRCLPMASSSSGAAELIANTLPSGAAELIAFSCLPSGTAELTTANRKKLTIAHSSLDGDTGAYFLPVLYSLLPFWFLSHCLSHDPSL